MEWWQWVVLGAVILAAETIIDSEFYLIFIGVSAIAVGLNGFALYSFPLWGQWLLFATLAGGSTIVFRRKLYQKLRGNPLEIEAGVVGETGIALDSIGIGERGHVELRGTTWAAKNIGHSPIPARGRALVKSCEGLTLYIQLEP